MPDIKIEFEQLRQKARDIRVHNNTLKSKLEEIKRKIQSLSADWTSDASDTIRTKIEKEERRIDDYSEVIESYCKFLDKTAEK